MKSVMLCNMVIKSVFALCVTIAAIYFGKAGILWWYVLFPFIGYEYKSTPSKKESTEQWSGE